MLRISSWDFFRDSFLGIRILPGIPPYKVTEPGTTGKRRKFEMSWLSMDFLMYVFHLESLHYFDNFFFFVDLRYSNIVRQTQQPCSIE